MGRFMKSLLLVATCAVSHTMAADYAVLVAGSNGYENYRHQADVCHAFQILMGGGFQRENIILMSYDDVAYDSGNPYYGQLFNRPTGTGVGRDVRKGCDPDYKGGNVTAANFLAVLKGDQQGANGGKVLNTTIGDNIFVNFVDHGGVGIVAFPDGGLLHATDLTETLTTMHRQNKYSRLTFYMEACESGSMFATLPPNISIYATTAANADEPSWGTYCPPDDVISGQEMGTCLGDLYSVNWMENADSTELDYETLEKQFKVVRNLTTKSHVQQFGDEKLSRLPAAIFEGRGGEHPVEPREFSSEISSRDIPLHIAYYKYLRSSSKTDFYKFILEAEQRSQADLLFTSLLATYPPHLSQYTLDAPTLVCAKQVHEAVNAYCGGYSDYSMKYSYIAADLCGYTNLDAVGIVSAVEKVCKGYQKRA
eukprot:TRINITY_DN867_c2_g1_i1.p1 TRINITY_DN867_c2_g1~~TRINITY_DN867_c2_g1_i1.p1  ORF type:complete len:423 (+),score=84.77 TRINITY_DN867_c2_g1_i1:93-1361(+)